MERKMKNDGKVIMSVLAFVGLIVLVMVGASLWFEYQDKIVTVRRVTEKVRPVVKNIVDKTTEIVPKVVTKIHKGTTELLSARKRYEQALDEFDAQKEEYSQELEEGKNALLTFQEAMKIAQDKDVEFAKVYTKWEGIELEVVKIQEKFANLISGADILYTELEDRTNSITGEHLRQITLRKVTESRKRYSLRLQTCKSGVDKLSLANTMVQNMMIALEVDYGLEVLEETIDRTLQEIDTMIEAIMMQLEELSLESKKLLEIRVEEVLTKVYGDIK